MKKRSLLVALSVGVVLFVLAAAGTYFWLSADDYKNLRDAVADKLREDIGVELAIDGDVRISLSLNPTVSLAEVSLTNPNWDGEKTLVTAGRLEVRFALIPLIISGEFDSHSATVVDGKVYIDHAPSGRSNWSFGDKSVEDDSSSQDTLSSLPDITRVNLKNVGVYLTGPGKDEKHVFLVHDLSADAPDHEQATTISGSGRVDTFDFSIDGSIDTWKAYRENKDSVLSLTVTMSDNSMVFSGTLGPSGQRFKEGVAFTLKGKSLSFLNPWLRIALPVTESYQANGNLGIDGDRIAIKVDNTEVVQGPDKVTGNGDITIDDGKVTLDTRLNVQGDDMQKTGEWLSGLDLLPQPLPATGNFKATGTLKGPTDALSITDIDATVQTAAGSNVFKGDIANVNEMTGLNFDVKLDGKNLAEFLAPIAPITTIDFSLPATDSYAASANIQGDLETLSATGITADARSGELQVSATGSITDLNKLEGLDAKVTARGQSLERLAGILGLSAFPTRTFSGSGQLTGTLDNLDVSKIDGKLETQDAGLTVTGSIKRIAPLHGIDLQLDLSGGDLSTLSDIAGVKLPETATFRSKGRLSGNGDALSLADLVGSVDIFGESIDVTGTVDDVAALSGLTLDIQGSGTNLSRVARQIDLALPAGIGHQYSGSLTGSVDALTLSGGKASIHYKDTTVSLAGSMEDVLAVKGIDAMIDLAGPADQVAALASSDWDDAAPVKLNGKFSGSPDAFEFSDFSITAGESRTEGTVRIELGAEPSIGGSLGSTVIAVHAADPVPDEEQSDTNVQFGWIDKLDIDLSYQDLTIRRNNADFDLQPGQVVMRDGALNLDPLAVEYQGNIISGKVRIDGASDLMSMTLQSQGLDYGQLLKDLDVTDKLSAKGNFYVEVTGTGADEVTLKNSLSGKARFLVGSGTVADFGSTNLSYTAQLMPWRDKAAALQFSCILTSMDIKDGIVDLGTMFMGTEDMIVTGGGTVNLAAGNLDLAIAPRATKKRLLNSNISLFVTGDLSDPHLSVGKLSTISDVGIKYGSWAVLGPFALALPFLPSKKAPDCATVTQGILEEQGALPAASAN